MRVKQLIVAAIIALVFALPLSLSASASGSTGTFAGQTYDLCDHVRPEHPSYTRYHCDAP
jgi:hypothetical protein